METTHLPPISESELSDEQVLQELLSLKQELSEKVVILGHHYQHDEIIRFADITGDSLILSQKAASIDRPFIVFCGVHFMAETADILAKEGQQVILPDLSAGCSMADMANEKEVEKAFHFLTEASGKEKIIPVTYVNSSAAIKAIVGEHEGYTCTSSNAEKIIARALQEGEKLFFLPDQHLGRNTCAKMGIPLENMIMYDPRRKNGGLKAEEVQKAKVILWYGYCSVHQGFKPPHVEFFRKNHPDTKIIVHPECEYDVVKAADLAGSTAYIIDVVKKAPTGAKFAVGTEINLVNRLQQECPDKSIVSLSPYQCLCTTMYRIRPRWLLHVMRGIRDEKVVNVIKVDERIKYKAKLAIDRMLQS